MIRTGFRPTRDTLAAMAKECVPRVSGGEHEMSLADEGSAVRLLIVRGQVSQCSCTAMNPAVPPE